MNINNLNSHAQNQNYPYVGYAIFQIVSNPIFYIIWTYFNQQQYENFFLRLMITIMCIPLLLKNYWPNKLLIYLPLYWYITIFYSIIFFFTFMILKNHLNYMWSLNFISGLVLWILILDYKTLFYLTPPGFLVGYLVFLITTPALNLPIEELKTITVTSSAIFIFGYIFSQRNNKFTKQKLNDLQAQSAAIAHEMRTPLANVLMGADALKKTADRLEQVANQDTPQSHQILKRESHEILKLSKRLKRIAKGGQNFINLLLTNLRQDFKEVPLTPLSMENCLQIVMEEYAFRNHEQEKVHFDIKQDFTFQGNEELTIHIFLNLMKNSLYFIQATGKGEIFITVDETPLWYQVIFKDTGPGIESHRLSHLFTPFYSKRPHGTGIGLSFCKKAMESMNGQIEVSSIFGQETIFTLYLPKTI